MTATLNSIDKMVLAEGGTVAKKKSKVVCSCWRSSGPANYMCVLSVIVGVQGSGGAGIDTAILQLAEPVLTIESVRAANQQLADIPFSSANKYMVTVNATENGPTCVFMKGAPEYIVARCATVIGDSADRKEEKLSAEMAAVRLS
jgi:hypothetical protein